MINDGFVEHSILSLEKNHINAYIDERVECAWFACLLELSLNAKSKRCLEGFVEKTESNTHHYFKLKDWDEWTCIDGIKDAITEP